MSNQNQLNQIPVLHFSTLPQLDGNRFGKLTEPQNNSQLFGHFLPEGKTIYHIRCVGMQGTLFCQQLCLSVAGNQSSFLREPITRNGNVLYIMAQDKQAADQDILKYALKSRPFPLTGQYKLLTYAHNWNTAMDLMGIYRLIETYKPVLIVVMVREAALSAREKRKAKARLEFIYHLTNLCHNCPGTLLVSAPSTWPENPTSLIDPDGAAGLITELPAVVSGYFVQEPPQDYGPYQVIRTGLYRSHESTPVRKSFYLARNGWYTLLEEREQQPGNTDKKQDAVQLRSQGMSYQEIADHLGCSRSTVQRLLKSSSNILTEIVATI